jgi:hypothetical protein
MERINRYVKEGTESFDDLYPVRRRGPSFERVLSWLSGHKFLRNYVLTNTGLRRAPLEWNPPSLAGGIRVRRDPGLDSLARLVGDGARICDLRLRESERI